MFIWNSNENIFHEDNLNWWPYAALYLISFYSRIYQRDYNNNNCL